MNACEKNIFKTTLLQSNLSLATFLTMHRVSPNTWIKNIFFVAHDAHLSIIILLHYVIKTCPRFMMINGIKGFEKLFEKIYLYLNFELRIIYNSNFFFLTENSKLNFHNLKKKKHIGEYSFFVFEIISYPYKGEYLDENEIFVNILLRYFLRVYEYIMKKLITTNLLILIKNLLRQIL